MVLKSNWNTVHLQRQVLSRHKNISLNLDSLPISVGSVPEQVERESGNPKMRVEIAVETTIFRCSLQCQIIMNL